MGHNTLQFGSEIGGTAVDVASERHSEGFQHRQRSGGGVDLDAHSAIATNSRMGAPIEANGMVIDRNIRFDIGFLRCRWVEDQNFLTIRTNVSERFSFGNDAVCN